MRRFAANVLYLFAGLPLALSALLLVSVRPWALDRETYRRIALDDGLYAALQAPELAARTDREIVLRPVAGGPEVSLDGPALVGALQRDLPWPSVKAAASGAIDAVYDSIASGRPGGEIDLRPLKSALRRSVPAVARDYVAGAKAAGRSLPASLDTPAEVSLVLAASVDSMPDSARAAPAPAAPRARLPMLSRGPEALSQALLNRTSATMAAFAALLLAGLGALGGTTMASRLSRAGRYLLLPSILILGIGAALAIPGGLILQGALPAPARAVFEGAAGTQLRAYLASALGPIARSFFLTGLVGASVGGVLASARRFSAGRELEDGESGRKELE